MHGVPRVNRLCKLGKGYRGHHAQVCAGGLEAVRCIGGRIEVNHKVSTQQSTHHQSPNTNHLSPIANHDDCKPGASEGMMRRNRCRPCRASMSADCSLLHTEPSASKKVSEDGGEKNRFCIAGWLRVWMMNGVAMMTWREAISPGMPGTDWKKLGLKEAACGRGGMVRSDQTQELAFKGGRRQQCRGACRGAVRRDLCLMLASAHR